jgi:hypothetical protein
MAGSDSWFPAGVPPPFTTCVAIRPTIRPSGSRFDEPGAARTTPERRPADARLHAAALRDRAPGNLCRFASHRSRHSRGAFQARVWLSGRRVRLSNAATTRLLDRGPPPGQYRRSHARGAVSPTVPTTLFKTACRAASVSDDNGTTWRLTGDSCNTPSMRFDRSGAPDDVCWHW